MLDEVRRPASAVSPLTSGIGFFAFWAALAVLVGWGALDTLRCAILACAIAATAMAIVELLVFRVSYSESTGLDWSTAPRENGPRIFTKLAGLAATLAAVAAAYWVLPVYRGEFYLPFYQALAIIVPLWLALAFPYFWYVDRRQREPYDGYWHMGLLVTGRAASADRGAIAQHLLGWLVRAYFLPLMLVYLVLNIDWLRFAAFNPRADWLFVYEGAFRLTIIVDLAFSVIGYALALRITDSHLRSVDSTMFGWLVTLVCFEPFWSLINSSYLNYENGRGWSALFPDGGLLAWVWGGAIIALLVVYSWSTVVFGLRFSNLTHRGIITSGPYRWLRHPAYLSKSLSAWLIAVPFIPAGVAPMEAVRLSALLLLLNGVYFLRAWTEERHLRRDPVYVRYADWIDRHGLVARLRRLTPVVSFSRRKKLV